MTSGNIAAPAVDMIDQLVDEGGIPPLVKLMTSKLPADGVRAAKFAMLSLSNALSSQVSDRVAEKVESAVRVAGLKCGLYAKLVALLDTWANDSDAHPELRGSSPVLAALWGLCNRGESALHVGSQPGCFPALLRLMSSERPKLRYDAAGVLVNLVEREDNAELFRSIGGIDVLTKLKADHAAPAREGNEELSRPQDKRSISYLAGLALNALSDSASADESGDDEPEDNESEEDEE